jgi:hypothetical protein
VGACITDARSRQRYAQGGKGPALLLLQLPALPGERRLGRRLLC